MSRAVPAVVPFPSCESEWLSLFLSSLWVCRSLDDVDPPARLLSPSQPNPTRQPSPSFLPRFPPLSVYLDSSDDGGLPSFLPSFSLRLCLNDALSSAIFIVRIRASSSSSARCRFDQDYANQTLAVLSLDL